MEMQVYYILWKILWKIEQLRIFSFQLFDIPLECKLFTKNIHRERCTILINIYVYVLLLQEINFLINIFLNTSMILCYYLWSLFLF